MYIDFTFKISNLTLKIDQIDFEKQNVILQMMGAWRQAYLCNYIPTLKGKGMFGKEQYVSTKNVFLKNILQK